MKINKNIKFFFWYLIILLFFSYIFLYNKHLVGNDSTISEYLINYEGGFTKRGLVGQIAIEISRIFYTKLRWSIFLIQSFACTVYFVLLYNFFKYFEFDKFVALSVFSPIFILYPLAEIEVLARKEIIIFSLFLIYLTVSKKNYFRLFYLSLFSSLSVLIWEPVIFFFPIIVFLEIIKNKIYKINLNFIKILISFFPSLIICAIFILDPLSQNEHDLMTSVLKNEFGEACYMSCDLLRTKSTLAQQFEGNFKSYSAEVFIRYALIIIIGFYPLNLLIKSSSLNDKNLLFTKVFKNFSILLFITLVPILMLFAMGYDWGRWVNVTYVFLILVYFNLLTNNCITLDKSKLIKNWISKFKNKIFFTFFIIFCFGWHPKTVITDDVGSIPGYRVPYKIFKILKNKVNSFNENFKKTF